MALCAGGTHCQPLLGLGALAYLLPGLRRDTGADGPSPGTVGAALWYHTPVVITLALAAIYLFSQTAWRLRGKRGWVLRYDRRWPMVLVGLFLANCVVRNVLWLGLGVPL